MRTMVEEFHSHLANVGLPTKTLNRFDTMLESADYDMENLIEYVEKLEGGQTIQQTLGLDVNDTLLDATRTMRWEAEWFVQHTCERFRAVDAKVLWGSTLRNVGKHELCVATSNYDRLLEVACGFWSVSFDDGFDPCVGGEATQWRGIEAAVPGRITLLKVHGSTDWYKAGDGSIYKLRHSMPLYGDLALSLGDGDSALPKLTSALILPTREKLVNEPPYPDLTTYFRNASREAAIAIFVGTSLRDPDLRDMCRQCALRVPTYLVTTMVDADVSAIPKLKVIEGTASGFLTSTLPKFLVMGSVDYLDACAGRDVRTVGKHSVLAPMVAGLEESGGRDEACAAIDKLVDYGASLDEYDLARLLKNDELAVRRYGLALIPEAINVAASMSMAKQQAENEGDGAFAKELEMLVELMDTNEDSVG